MGVLSRWLSSPVAALTVLVLGLILAMVGRTAIVAACPQAAIVYAALGLPVNLSGLAVTEVASDLAPGQGGVLSVTGRIANVSDRTRIVPPLLVTVEGEPGQVLYHWTVNPARDSLAKGAATTFQGRLAAPPEGARRVTVGFAPDRSGQKVASGAR